jgi:UDP-glucose:glycoprotein glucosyltransferase
MAMDVPTSWLVRPREALYDLDNIQLNKLFPGDNAVEAAFDLDYLVIEGHAREAVSNVAPRGVQLQLVERGVAIDDTQVVANLGYFQFKAVPGVFKLETRPGRSSKIFKLDSAGNEGWDSPSVEQAGDEITVTSFEGLTLYPRLTRRPGMETVDVLEEEQESATKGVFDDLSSRYDLLYQLGFDGLLTSFAASCHSSSLRKRKMCRLMSFRFDHKPILTFSQWHLDFFTR